MNSRVPAPAEATFPELLIYVLSFLASELKTCQRHDSMRYECGGAVNYGLFWYLLRNEAGGKGLEAERPAHGTSARSIVLPSVES